ncbi:MAG: hypothetical protein ACRDHZ_24345, partial [Ktedonobacteraceae bacterium]
GGLGVAEIKEHKRIEPREELLDRMGRAELAANDFRITQTEELLKKAKINEQTQAITAHHEVGKKVRTAIADIGGTMPENLPAEPSLKSLLDAKHKQRPKKLPIEVPSNTNPNQTSQKTLWETE